MLQRREFADRLAELLALLEVADRAAEPLLAEPDHFGSHRAPADIEHAVQELMALVDLAEHAVGIDLDIVEGDPRRVVRIDHDGAFGLDAFCLWIDQEQRQPIALAGGARGAGRHDQEIRDMAGGHPALAAPAPETVAGTHRLPPEHQRATLRPLLAPLTGKPRPI